MSLFVAEPLFMSVLCISEPVSPRTPSAPRISLGIASPAAAAGRLLPAIVICLTDTVGFDLLLPWKKRKTHLSFYFVLSIVYRRSSTFWRWGVWAGCPPPASHPLSKRLGGTWEGGRAQAGAARTPPPCHPQRGASHSRAPTRAPCPPAAFPAGLIWAGHALEALLKLMLLTELLNCF